jgi:uncharacterized protein YutE (UPF0331/DUF86 family)
LKSITGTPKIFKNYTKQDSIILNIQRACEACIDLAMYLVSEKKLGIPQTSREAFELLFQDGIIDAVMAKKLKAMVGFRNIAVHNYQAVNLDIVNEIIIRHINDFGDFAELILKRNS